jgi:superfamily I DNA and/or RNA helicase
MDRASEIKSIVKNQVEQFEQYLRNSIITLWNKQIQASWEQLKISNLAKLKIIGSLYQYNKQTIIRITDNRKGWYRIKLLKGTQNFFKKIEYQIGDKEGEISITEDVYEKGLIYIEGIEAIKFDALKWGFADIELIPAWFAINTNKLLKNSNGKEYKIIAVDNDNITIAGALQSDEELYCNDMKISFIIIKEAKLPIQNANVLKENNDSIIYYSRERLIEDKNIIFINYQAKDFIDFSNIIFEKNPNKTLQFNQDENSDELSIILQNDFDYNETVISNGIYFKIMKTQDNDIENYKIQLKEKDNGKGLYDEQEVLSPLRYFFDEDVYIVDDKEKKYIVERKGCNQDENIIVLRREATEEEKERKIFNPFCLPPKDAILRVRVDTSQLERQLAAVSILKQMPHKGHELLIRLFDKLPVLWAKPENELSIDDDKWFVLKDKNRSGCDDQRKFIENALNTPDFAILEGPPGSGKTTVILELICQLVSQKKRVLLCGSTNVAVDNIFERLIEKDKNGLSIVERIDILPVRVGRSARVEQNIIEYQIDNLIGECSTEEEFKQKQCLLLDAANLVCGTTMSIAKHPKFNSQVGRVYRLSYEGDSPVIPEFDYLIIDESSKTTFQEFLVPALYAKRWILAGDVMQLSPYTERENIEFNFERIRLKKKIEKNEYEYEYKYEELNEDIQRAIFFLNSIRRYLYWNNKENETKGHNKFIFPCSSSLLEKIVQELSSGRISKFTHEELFICIVKRSIDQSKQHKRILLRTLETINYLELTAANVILVESSIVKRIIEKFPETHAMLQLEDWETMSHAFYHNVYQQKSKFSYFSRENGNVITNSFDIVKEINKTLKERTWAQEIAWRVDSEHQLRLVDESARKKNLGKTIDELTPCSVDKGSFEEARNIIAAISFPSILESLMLGIKGKKPKTPSTITMGFPKDDLENRKTTLTFQHRMHPDISVFPRNQFYKAVNALEDLEMPKPIKEAREWSYSRYNNKRSIWINVNSPTVGSKNIYEVKAMMQHLEYFLEYAVKHPQPEGKLWEVACLAFYRSQELLIREGDYNHRKKCQVNGLQELTNNRHSNSNFYYNKNKEYGPYPILIRLHSVDRFQGHEADVVLLSMSRTEKDGFLDSPNRLNVSITRAKFQLIIFGKYDYFSNKSRSGDLRALALAHKTSVIDWREN